MAGRDGRRTAPPISEFEAINGQAIAAMGCTKSDGEHRRTRRFDDITQVNALGAPRRGGGRRAAGRAVCARAAHAGVDRVGARRHGVAVLAAELGDGVADGFAPSVGYALTTYCGLTALQMLQGCRPTPERVALLGYAEAKRTLDAAARREPRRACARHAGRRRAVHRRARPRRAAARDVVTVADGEKARDVRHGALLLLPERFLASCLEEYTRPAPRPFGAALQTVEGVLVLPTEWHVPHPDEGEEVAASAETERGATVKVPLPEPDTAPPQPPAPGALAAALAPPPEVRAGQRVDVARAEGRRVHYVAMA